jgi:prolyl-tRNA editing enzyme YbaK/EbsC (Cys-tRNA(Pro) deacylase)
MSELLPIVETALENISTPYEVFSCDPDLADTAAFCDAYGFAPEECANTIVVIGKSDPPVYVACVVLATTKLDVNKTVSKKLGVKRCSFANGEQTAELTGMMIGGVTAIGLPGDLALWIDSAVMNQERIVLGGGNRSSKLLCAPKLLEEMPNSEVVENLAIVK